MTFFLRYVVQLFILGLFLYGALTCHRQQVVQFAEIIGLDKDAPREVTLRVVQLQPLSDRATLANERMVVTTGARLLQHLIGQWAGVSHSFEELAKRLDESMRHQPLELALSTDDGIARGRSFESMLALSAFSHLEEIFSFTASYNPRLAFKRPLNVAIYGEILLPDGQTQAVSKNDNVLYVGSADTIFLLPLGKEQGLPLTMHEGVLAHEFHHRIFFNTIWNNPGFSNLWPLFKSRYNVNDTRLSRRSRVLLNALDEGLADVFAVAFTGLPNYLDISLTERATDSLRRQRDLLGAFVNVATYDLLATSDLPIRYVELCGENSNNFENQKFNAYCLGTVVAKTLFEASRSNAKALREDFLPLITPALNGVARALDEGRQFDLDIFFDELSLLVKQRSSSLHERLCSEIKKRFASIGTEQRLPSCS